MSRVGESAGYLGGIGAMLEVSHMCPRCGKRLSSSPLASARHLAGRGCRPTVFAALPERDLVAAEPEGEDPPPLPAAQRIRDFESPVQVPATARHPAASLPTPAASIQGRVSSIPWLPPPDLGEVF